jgi:hypothetical protein
MKGHIIAAVAFGFAIPVCDASAQTILAEKSFREESGVQYTSRDVAISPTLTVSLKHVQRADGMLVLRSADQSSADLQKLDTYCRSFGEGLAVGRTAEIVLSKGTTSLLPCVADAPPPERMSVIEKGKSASAARHWCGNVSVTASLSGPGSMAQHSSEQFVAEGDFEYDGGGGGQTATLSSNPLPSCYSSVSSGIQNWGYALHPFWCHAAYPKATYTGDTTAELCGVTDTYYSLTSIF